MPSPTRIKILLLGFSKSLVRLFLRYLVGLVVGIIPLGTSILFERGNSLLSWVITSNLFVLALPSILVWHVLNEAIRLSNFEVKYQEHMTAFGVAIIMVVLSWLFMNTSLDPIVRSILNCLFVLFAVLNSYLYVRLCRRFLPNIGC
jgi:hypothetical protein